MLCVYTFERGIDTHNKQLVIHCYIILHVFVSLDLVSDMLGSEKYKLSWQTALDSFQDPYINR